MVNQFEAGTSQSVSMPIEYIPALSRQQVTEMLRKPHDGFDWLRRARLQLIQERAGIQRHAICHLADCDPDRAGNEFLIEAGAAEGRHAFDNDGDWTEFIAQFDQDQRSVAPAEIRSA
jgi:hypothetical protein